MNFGHYYYYVTHYYQIHGIEWCYNFQKEEESSHLNELNIQANLISTSIE